MRRISLVVPAFNSVNFIHHCLDSLLAQGGVDFEVIVIDNGSKDGTADFLKEKYPQIRLIENKENAGACQARNQGIEVSRGDWVMTLDCDVALEKDFLKKMIDFADSQEASLGMLQPKILGDDAQTIYSCGIHLSKLKRFYDVGRGMANNGNFNAPRYVLGACSAAALYRRKMLEEIKEDTGYFDRRFFFLVEDVDISLRAQKKNWKALYYPEAVCYHAGNSSQTSKEMRQYLSWRNRRALLAKHRFNKMWMFMSSVLYDLPRLPFLLLTNHYVREEISKNG